MLSVEQVNRVWALLDEAGALFVERHRGESIRQTAAVDEIASIALEISKGEWTREQILEGWLHQAMNFIHGATGRFAPEPDEVIGAGLEPRTVREPSVRPPPDKLSN